MTKVKDLQAQVARIKQIIGKVLDEDKSLAERIRGQNITIVSILSALSVSVSTIVLTIIGVFGVGRGPTASGSSVPKDERSLKNG